MTTSTEPAKVRFSVRPVVGLAVLAAMGGVAWALSAATFTLPVFLVFGLGYGFVLQRSRFCFASAFRDLFLLQDGRMLKAILGGMALATPGFALAMFNLMPNLSPGRFPLMAAISPAGAHTFVGAFIFGVGMVVAGGCLSGTIYRIGEGYVASMVAMVGVLAGFALLLHTWNWWWEVTVQNFARVWLPQSLGWTGAIAVTLLGLFLIYLFVLWWESRAGGVAPRRVEMPLATGFGQRLGQSYGTVFRRGWPAVMGGLTLAMMNIFEYMFQRPWGLTSEISHWSAGLLGLVGLTPPELAGLGEGLGSCGLAASGTYLNDGLMINGGMVVGSLVAALLAGEFRLRWPRQRRRYLQSLLGGVGIGYGAGLALGCNIGGFFSAIPSLGLNGWVFAGGISFGAFSGVQIIKRIG